MSSKKKSNHKKGESETEKKPLRSVAVPLEDDSDPDFNPGVYEGDSDQHRRSKKDKKGKAFKRKRRPPQPAAHSKPYASLRDYFGYHALGFHSSSDVDDEDRASVVTSSVDSERDSEKEESCTEPDEEETQGMNPLKRQAVTLLALAPPSKKRKANPEEEESITESETDYDPPPVLVHKPLKNTADNDEDSVTQPESDDGLAGDTSFLDAAPDSNDGQPTKMYPHRPTFAYASGRPKLPPFSLNLDEGLEVPAPINTCLRDYQREGVRFFYERWAEGEGGLLGDDMGLGTSFLLCISCLELTPNRQNDSGHLFFVSDNAKIWRCSGPEPASEIRVRLAGLVHVEGRAKAASSERDVANLFDNCTNPSRPKLGARVRDLGVYHDKQPAERKRVLADFKLGRLDVVVTSHELARGDIAELFDLPWSVIIVDEVHKVKNPKSHTTEAFHLFNLSVPSYSRAPSRRLLTHQQPNSALSRKQVRFGLTGTAVQNSYLELWTILDWANPGQAGSLTDWKHFVSEPLTRGQSASATDEERVLARKVSNTLTYRFLPRFFLRRTKKVIQDQLPKKTDEVVFCPLTWKQIDVYKRILAIPSVQAMARAHEECDCGRKKPRNKCHYRLDNADIFRYMSTLIKISNHVALILPSKDDSEDQLIRHRELCSQVFPPDPIPKSGTAILDSDLCGKWKVLETLLREWRKDPTNKVLIFTKSVKLLNMLDHYLALNHFGFVKLEGKVPSSERMPLIDRFHQDPNINIFLISTLTGGTGLNLTGANKVVIFDPNWNPAQDLQAMDRAYRFGQTRDVSVYRLLGAGSIEELIYARQVYKQQQMHIAYEASAQTRYFEGVQGDKQRQGELFGLKNIFSFQEEALVTKMAIERAHMTDLDWALKNIQTLKGVSKNPVVDGVALETEAQRSKGEDDLQGLGALMFSDALPAVSAVEDSEIRKSLDDKGIKYRHFNDEVLLPNKLEELRERTGKKPKSARGSSSKVSGSKDRKKSKKGGLKPEPVEEAQWPPVRRHHRPLARDPLDNLRQELVDIGRIPDLSYYPEFATKFVKMSEEEQSEILRQVEAHRKKKRGRATKD